MPRWIRLRLGGVSAVISAEEIISLWPGTVGSIPTGWVREALLDDRYLLGAPAATEPGTAGGQSTHTHTSPSHTHTFSGSFPSGTRTTPLGRARTPSLFHSHGSTTSNPGTVSITAASNDAPYVEFVAVKASADEGIPNGGCAFYNSGSLPTNWVECDGTGGTIDARNRFPKGAGAGSGGGGTGGSSDAHTHTNSHSHSSKQSAASDSTGNTTATGFGGAAGAHRHNVSLLTKSITINNGDAQPPWKKLMCIENQTGGADAPSGVIVPYLRLLADIPSGWVLCDGSGGTPDMRDYFIKNASGSGEIGNTGGADSHTHTTVNHNHTASASAALTEVYALTGVTTVQINSHSHFWSVGSSAVTINSNLSKTNYPLYRTVVFLQKT